MEKVSQMQLLDQMQKIAQKTKMTESVQSTSQTAQFGDFLVKQIDKVNEASQTATELTTKFALGDPGVTLPQAMIATEKASVYSAFLREARNKVINAYNEIMNMSV